LLFKDLQGFFRQFDGEIFNIIGTFRSIGNLIEIAFIFKDQQLVTSYTVTEFIVLVINSIVGSIVNSINPAQDCTHTLSSCAKQVHVKIIKRLVSLSGL